MAQAGSLTMIVHVFGTRRAYRRAQRALDSVELRRHYAEVTQSGDRNAVVDVRLRAVHHWRPLRYPRIEVAS